MKRVVAIVLCLLTLFLCACGIFTMKSAATFSDYTNSPVFRDIPTPKMRRFTIEDAGPYGEGFYVIALKTKKAAKLRLFTNYVRLLQDNGFLKVADNGEAGIGDGSVYCANLQKGDMILTVSFSSRNGMMYLSANTGRTFSPNLVYRDSYVSDNIPEAKTTLTMNQIEGNGNSYVIQLKNGHYIVNDGGFPQDMEKLVRSLKENAPSGEKPVIEAWFFSHDHYDHVGVLRKSSHYADQLIVEGFYSNQISYAAASKFDYHKNKNYGVPQKFSAYYQNTAGEQTPIYRMHAGERYYFNDIFVDVLYTNEQIPAAKYKKSLNLSCTWLMYHIEGQKFLISADAERANVTDVAAMYQRDYLDVDLMNAPHHGINVGPEDPELFRPEVVLYSAPGYNIEWKQEALESNIQMMKNADEFFCYGEGGIKLTFPYVVGTAEKLEPTYPEAATINGPLARQWVAENITPN